ncbi:MAG: ECF transporter S component [Anaerolineales bacterium]
MRFLVYLLAGLLGLAAFIAPFLRPSAGSAQARSPLVLTLLLLLAFLALALETQAQAAGTQALALLGSLVALNAGLRFVETVLPGPGGFSPIFFLILLVGYVFGARLGFLMGALTLFVSALFTGGVGPWLPAQMFAAGWVGMSAPLVRPLVRPLAARWPRTEVYALAALGVVWGFVFGAVMNLWFWPLAVGPAEQSWQAGLSLRQAVGRYVTFYAVTSFGWDAMRAAGNAALILLLGPATLHALRRFQSRTFWEATVDGRP